MLAYGFLCAADARFERAVRRHKKSALLLGIFRLKVYNERWMAQRNGTGLFPREVMDRYPVPEWVHQQVYQHPYPKELMLRNCV